MLISSSTTRIFRRNAPAAGCSLIKTTHHSSVHATSDMRLHITNACAPWQEILDKGIKERRWRSKRVRTGEPQQGRQGGMGVILGRGRKTGMNHDSRFTD